MGKRFRRAGQQVWDVLGYPVRVVLRFLAKLDQALSPLTRPLWRFLGRLGLALRKLLTWIIWKPIWLITMPFWLPLSWLWEGIRSTILLAHTVVSLVLATVSFLDFTAVTLAWGAHHMADSGVAGKQDAPLLASALGCLRAAPRQTAPSLGLKGAGMAGTLVCV
jgi:hypothetical protein